jgi:hypothetical protein
MKFKTTQFGFLLTEISMYCLYSHHELSPINRIYVHSQLLVQALEALSHEVQ